MTKTKQVYVCSECGEEHIQWQGQCKSCNQWNSLKSFSLKPKSSNNSSLRSSVGFSGSKIQLTSLNNIKDSKHFRFSSSISELDTALGGGIVVGGVAILGGAPGIGKSTLLLQICMTISSNKKVLYVSGEESLSQISMRAKRLGQKYGDLQLLAHTNVEDILAIANDYEPELLVIDSIQTMFIERNTGEAGGVSQIKDSATHLTRYAKQKNCSIFMIGHVTKSGEVAGPKVLEHIVDTVLYFDSQEGSKFKTIRAIKNRYGAVNEIGVFAMSDNGLKPVKNPSSIFLSNSSKNSSGTIITSTWEGSRTLLVELQALVSDNESNSIPRRISIGQDQYRLAMLLAVLGRHVGISVGGRDVFLNVVGGVRVNETATDLPSILAIVSSIQGKIIPRDLLCFGEVGLSGEIRPVVSGVERMQEALRQGFKTVIAPTPNFKGNFKIEGMNLCPVSDLGAAVSALKKYWI